MKLFNFYRIEDESGVSGTGPVVEGVQFTNGWCALRWVSDRSSLCFYQSLEDVKKIHSHGGKTEIIVHDFETPTRRNSRKTTREFELFMEIIEEVSRAIHAAKDGLATPEMTHAAIESAKCMLDELEAKLDPNPPTPLI